MENISIIWCIVIILLGFILWMFPLWIRISSSSLRGFIMILGLILSSIGGGLFAGWYENIMSIDYPLKTLEIESLMKLNDALNPDVEYELEILNQDSVRIHSLSTGKTYFEKVEDIYKVLEKDNL